MFDKEAIEALAEAQSIDAARRAIENAPPDEGGVGVVALPSDYEYKDLEQYLPQRRRARGNFTTASHEHFADYTAKHAEAGATVFVSRKAMTATAVLNLGTPEEPGHGDNTATLELAKTAAYTAMLGMLGHQTQKNVAEWMDTWPECLECFHEGEPIKTGLAAMAVRRITVAQTLKQDSEERTLGASRSTFEDVQASGRGDPLPTTIYWHCEPYQGFARRTFVLRMSVMPGDKAPTLHLRLTKGEEHAEQMAAELAHLVARAVNEAAPDAAIAVLDGEWRRKE